MTSRETWRLRWALDSVPDDLSRLPVNLAATGLADIARGAVLRLSLGEWDKALAGHTFPVLAGMIEVKFDLPHGHRLRHDTGDGRHGPRFRVIASRDCDTRTISVWAIGPKDPRRFEGQRFSALELAEMRVIAADPARAEHASPFWHRRRRARHSSASGQRR